MDRTPPFVRKTGAQLGDGHELVLLGVVDTGEQSTGAELRALAFASVVTEQDDIDGVGQLAARVALQLHPVEVARTRLVGRVEPFGHDSFQAAADVVQQLGCEHLG